MKGYDFGNHSFLDIARDPDILDLVEQIIGPDIILQGCPGVL